MRNDEKMKQAWERCVDFNNNHPVGSSVIYHPVIGSDEDRKPSKTRSVAWVLGCGEPVVCIDGQTGGVSLDAIEVI